MESTRTDSGFTYVGLIILVAVLGMVGAATLKVNVLLERAEAERDLLDIGAAFTRALQSYASATPRGQPPQPPTLQELLRDPRFPNPRRHLRKVFVDPITGKPEWGIMYAAGQSGVIGVYSLSPARPFKVANFDPQFQNFENRDHLSDWKFTLSGQAALAPQAALMPANESARIEAEKLAVGLALKAGQSQPNPMNGAGTAREAAPSLFAPAPVDRATGVQTRQTPPASPTPTPSTSASRSAATVTAATSTATASDDASADPKADEGIEPADATPAEKNPAP